MGVATGRVSHTSTHPLTRRTVYHGPLVQLVEAMVGVIHGGQIITDSSTFAVMSLNLNEIAQRVPAQPDYTAMMARPRCTASFCSDDTLNHVGKDRQHYQYRNDSNNNMNNNDESNNDDDMDNT